MAQRRARKTGRKATPDLAFDSTFVIHKQDVLDLNFCFSHFHDKFPGVLQSRRLFRAVRRRGTLKNPIEHT